MNLFEEKLKQEMIQKAKEEKENQKKYVLKLRKQAKDLESKQSKKIEEKSLLYKPFINQKNTNNPNDYLFMKQYQKFLKNEQKLLEKENSLRKNYMRPFSNEEIDEFNSKMDKRREEKKLITEEKSQKLVQEWKERKKTIPTYVSPLHDKAYEDITNKFLEEKNKIEQRNDLLDKKKRL